jgi:hypothetical protein
MMYILYLFVVYKIKQTQTLLFSLSLSLNFFFLVLDFFETIHKLLVVEFYRIQKSDGGTYSQLLTLNILRLKLSLLLATDCTYYIYSALYIPISYTKSNKHTLLFSLSLSLPFYLSLHILSIRSCCVHPFFN